MGIEPMELQQNMKLQQFDQVIEKSAAILAEPCQPEAVYLLAMSHLNLKQHDKAIEVFQQLTRLHNVSFNWLNICTTAVIAKQFELAEEAYQKALALRQNEKDESNIPTPLYSFYYMSALNEVSNTAAALLLLNKMKLFYKATFITDNDYLMSRGLPPLNHFMPVALQILEKLENKKFSLTWLKEFKEYVDANGKKNIGKIEKAYKSTKAF